MADLGRHPIARCVLGAALCGATAGPARATDLLELHALATGSDPIYLAAREEWALGQEELQRARIGVYPQLGASAEASRTHQNIRDSDNPLFAVGTTKYWTEQFSISLTQPIYRWETLGRFPQARARVRQAAFELAAEEQDLVFRVAEATFGYLAARDGLDLATAERRANEQQLQESEQRLAAGLLGTISEVHEARARAQIARAAEITARNALDESVRRIAEITGREPEDLKTLSESFPLVQPDRPDSDLWVEAALFQNPRIKALEAAAEAAGQEVRIRRGSGRLPVLDLVASYAASDSGGTEFGGGNEIASGILGLRLTVPIFDGGRAAVETRSAAAEHRISLQVVERAKRRVELETRTAFQAVVTGITRVEALRQSVFSQQTALAVKEEGMRAGLATGLEVLDARRDLFYARTELARARYDYLLGGLSLKRWAGILSPRDLELINAYLQ